MEKFRNKHLKGVWRLPTFITLAGATQDRHVPSDVTREDVYEVDSFIAPPFTGCLPARHQPSHPSVSSHNNRLSESNMNEQIRYHYQEVDHLLPIESCYLPT